MNKFANRGYTKEILIQLLQDRARELGRPPRKDETPEHRSVRLHFGSWNKGLEAAGFQITHRMNIPKEEILSDIERVAQEIGKYPTFDEYRKLGGKFTNFSRFGGWVKLVGKRAKPHKVRRDDLIASMKQVVADLGYVPLSKGFQEHKFGNSLLTLYKNFDSYDELVIAAGFDIPVRKGGKTVHKTEDLIASIQQFYSNFGYTPSQMEFYEFNGTSPTFFRYKFGSYSKFVKLAGLKPNGHFPTRDGHVVNSRFEVEVDNFLYENSIPHRVQVRVCPDRFWTCDFVIGDTWIECDGYCGQDRPNGGSIRFQEKLRYYQDNSYDLIILRPNQDWELEIKVNFLLRHHK